MSRAGTGGCMPRYCEPSRPCSSAVTAEKYMACGGRCGGLREGPGQFEKDAAAGAVVGGAVVDVVAFRVGIDAEVIVVRGVEHGVFSG